MENQCFPNPSIFFYSSIKMVRGGFKSIDLGNAVILVSVFFGKHQFVFSKNAGMFVFLIISMCFCQNGCKVLSIRGMNNKSSIKKWPLSLWKDNVSNKKKLKKRKKLPPSRKNYQEKSYPLEKKLSRKKLPSSTFFYV